MTLLQIPVKERKSYNAILTNLKQRKLAKQGKSSPAKATADTGVKD